MSATSKPKAKKTTKKKGGRPTRYKKDFAEQARFLARFGLTDDDFAQFFGVTKQTINNWKKAHPQFFDSLKEGKNEADAAVEKSLYELATGYRHRVQKPMAISDGQGFGSHVEIVDYEEHLPPNVTACIFWLKNRQPVHWRDKQQLEHSGPNGGPIEHVDYSNLSDDQAKKLFQEMINKT